MRQTHGAAGSMTCPKCGKVADLVPVLEGEGAQRRVRVWVECRNPECDQAPTDG